MHLACKYRFSLALLLMLKFQIKYLYSHDNGSMWILKI